MKNEFHGSVPLILEDIAQIQLGSSTDCIEEPAFHLLACIAERGLPSALDYHERKDVIGDVTWQRAGNKLMRRIRHIKCLFAILCGDDSTRSSVTTDLGTVPQQQRKHHTNLYEVTLEALFIKLIAGGVSTGVEHTLLSNFEQLGYDAVTFLDFVKYLPLFAALHKDIITDPFNRRASATTQMRGVNQDILSPTVDGKTTMANGMNRAGSFKNDSAVKEAGRKWKLTNRVKRASDTRVLGMHATTVGA